MPPRAILVVEWDADLRRSIVGRIVDDGLFIAAEADSIASAEAMITTCAAPFDALILDMVLPDGDGCDLCVRLRRRGVRAPILLLADSSEEADLLHGFKTGANDYISKPVRTGELLARLRAHLRAAESSDDALVALGPYMFRPSAKLLHEPVKNRRIRLTDKEVRILRLLRGANGKPVSRQSLLDVVWGYNPAMTKHVLETHIYRLRQKIEPDPTNARLLVTVAGGYRIDFASKSLMNNADETTAQLHQVHLPAPGGQGVAGARRANGIGEAAPSGEHERCGGRKPDGLEWVAQLQAENVRLRRAITELTRAEPITAASADVDAEMPSGDSARRRQGV